jgi:hypothetical protein
MVSPTQGMESFRPETTNLSEGTPAGNNEDITVKSLEKNRGQPPRERTTQH